MTLEFYAKDVRFIIILHLLVIFNTIMVEILKSTDVQCLLVVTVYKHQIFSSFCQKRKKKKIQTTNLQCSIYPSRFTALVIFALPNNIFFLFSFVFIGMLQGSSQVSGSTSISLIGM